jgi:small subunit ribosomal protein S5
MSVCGVTDVLSKSLGSENAMNIVKAVMQGLENVMDARRIAGGRGKSVAEMWG